MKGREFPGVARDLCSGPGEAHWRAAAVHAYYALLLEGRDALVRWGFTVPPRQQVHAYVRLRFTYATNLDVKQLGDVLDDLVQFRNRASYDLRLTAAFANNTRGRVAFQDATDAVALLDAMEADPVRRAAAIASIQP